MFLHHEHSEVYYCIDNQTKLEIFSEGEIKVLFGNYEHFAHFYIPRNDGIGKKA